MALNFDLTKSTLQFDMEIDKEKVKLLKLKLDLMVSKTTDLTPVWAIARQNIIRDIKKVFETEGGSMGQKWVGLSKNTIKDRERKGFPPRPILVRTGTLRNSLFGGKLGIDKMTKNSWEYGTSVPYAIYHQSRRPRRKLPRRAFLYISNKFKGDLVKYMHKYMVTGKI